jgi:mannose-6-phosphate isomerase-like protein (cupin superfamily)
MSFDPSQTYIHLDSEGSATSLVGGDAFWSQSESELERFGRGWLVSEFECAADWSSWEMHPRADELVYLLSGSASMLLETTAGIRSIALDRRAAVIVPRGTWHTAKVSEPSRMLFVTMGEGTLHRPAP